MDKAVKFSENWKNAHKVKTVGLKRVSSNDSTKRARRKAVLESLRNLQRDSGAEFILFSRFPNKKKVSSFVDAIGTNATTFISSEVGKRVEQVWHEDSDKFQSERNKSGLITPAASNCESADSLNDFSNNPQIAAQEGSLHCENQLDLALINERHVDGQSTDSDSTAKSSQAETDGLALATNRHELIHASSMNLTVSKEQGSLAMSSALLSSIPSTNLERQSPPPEYILQRDPVGNARTTAGSAELPRTNLERSTPLDPGVDRPLQREISGLIVASASTVKLPVSQKQGSFMKRPVLLSPIPPERVAQKEPVVNVGTTAKSAELPKANLERSTPLDPDFDRPLQRETSGRKATSASTVKLPVPQKQGSLMKKPVMLSPIPPERVAQKDPVGIIEPLLNPRNCQKTYFKRSTPLNPATDPALQTERAKQLISQNKNTQARLMKVSTVPLGARVTHITLPDMSK